MASEKYFIVPATRTVTAGMKEKDSSFLCPANTVMTGRYHSGDENGTTQYEYASLKAIDSNGNPVAGTITVEDVKWDVPLKESSSTGYEAPTNRIIVGRKHSGDENGQTQYATAIVKLNGKVTTLDEGRSSVPIKESSGIWFKTDANRVITGRHHNGDENGQTFYNSAVIILLQGLSTEPAPFGTIIVPNVRTESEIIKESKSYFLCPPGTIMTGRYHWKDENGSTKYEYASLKAIDLQGRTIIGIVTVEDVRWENVLSESKGAGYEAPLNRVIVGMKHTGDEREMTYYATAVVKFNGYTTEIRDYTTSEPYKESNAGWFKTSANQVITGRHHFDDENGYTYYCMGTVSCDITDKPSDRFKIIVALHSEDFCFPMNPVDFIRLSRFRRHNPKATDDGYNKNIGGFVNGNSYDKEYFNIPVNIINTFYVAYPHNLRPKDPNSIGSGEVFLQPNDHLYGDNNPNGRVPVFIHSSYYKTSSGATGERREFWLFYGYDYANEGIDFSHQGDWERVTLDIVNNNIQGAWLDRHGDSKYYSVSELQISESNGVQTLRVFCAKGTHALYPKTGSFGGVLGYGTDYTDNSGYQWIITDKTEALDAQSWKLYAGAWGEVGVRVTTTGPLGPWYKRWDYGTIS